MIKYKTGGSTSSGKVLILEDIFTDARCRLVNDLDMMSLDARKARAYEDWEMLRETLRSIRKEVRGHQQNLDHAEAAITVGAIANLAARTAKEREVELRAIIHADLKYATYLDLLNSAINEKEDLVSSVEEAEKEMGEMASRLVWRSSIIRFYSTLPRAMPDDMLLVAAATVVDFSL